MSREAFDMHTDQRRMRLRPMRIRYTNRGKCLLCYLIAFAIPLLWQAAALGFIYPYRLAGTAPVLPDFVPLLTQPADASIASVLLAREQNWLMLLAALACAVWLVVVLMQLLWRFTRRASTRPFRATQRAVRSCRLMMLLIWAFCAGAAWALWTFGVSRITGRTYWDYLAYFGFYLLMPLAANAVSRLAAPAAISGRHAFFKRI